MSESPPGGVLITNSYNATQDIITLTAMAGELEPFIKSEVIYWQLSETGACIYWSGFPVSVWSSQYLKRDNHFA